MSDDDETVEIDPSRSGWPMLPSQSWHATLETLHLWTQVVGKVRMAQSPWLNHSWNVSLYVTPTGLTTGAVPHGQEFFQWDFDLLRGQLRITTSTGEERSLELVDGLTVAALHHWVLDTMVRIEMRVHIDAMPSEIHDATPFHHDTEHSSFDPAHAAAFHRALLAGKRVMDRFRCGFLGKASPVHFFWGSFDLAVTRFSGRTAPPHPGGLPNFPLEVAREAYSHEVTSVGFWPGNSAAPDPIFYAYAYPTPPGMGGASIEPEHANWSEELGEFVLPYERVVASSTPDEDLLRFFESTHEVAADLAGWDRTRLECDDPHGPDWWASRPHAPVEGSS